MAAVNFTATVLEVRDDTHSVYTLIVKPEHQIPFEPGQFFFIYRDNEGKKTAKAYSAASVPSQDTLEFCIKRVDSGFMSNTLYTLKKGEKIMLSGPCGFFTLQPITRQIVFLATGTGIAALRPMIHTIFAKGTSQDIWLLFGVKTQKDILFREEFEQLAKKCKNFHFIPVLSQEQWPGCQGHIKDHVWKNIKNNEADYYLCGLFNMVDEIKQALLLAGVDKGKIHFERYV